MIYDASLVSQIDTGRKSFEVPNLRFLISLDEVRLSYVDSVP